MVELVVSPGELAGPSESRSWVTEEEPVGVSTSTASALPAGEVHPATRAKQSAVPMQVRTSIIPARLPSDGARRKEFVYAVGG
jgi:hypothetical protein